MQVENMHCAELENQFNSFKYIKAKLLDFSWKF